MSQMRDVENLVQKNLDDIGERGEKLQILVNTTKSMRNEASTMHKRVS